MFSSRAKNCPDVVMLAQNLPTFEGDAGQNQVDENTLLRTMACDGKSSNAARPSQQRLPRRFECANDLLSY